MGRAIAAVVLGYLATAALVMGSLSAAYLTMGTERAFEPASYQVSTLWLVSSFILSFLAAIAGGYLCAVIARGGKAPLGLAALVIVLGFLMAGMAAICSPPPGTEVRTGVVSNFDAMQQARQPLWVMLTNVPLGAVGVLLGARLRGTAPAQRFLTS